MDASNKLNDNVVIATEKSTFPHSQQATDIVTFIKLIFTEIIYY